MVDNHSIFESQYLSDFDKMSHSNMQKDISALNGSIGGKDCNICELSSKHFLFISVGKQHMVEVTLESQDQVPQKVMQPVSLAFLSHRSATQTQQMIEKDKLVGFQQNFDMPKRRIESHNGSSQPRLRHEPTVDHFQMSRLAEEVMHQQATSRLTDIDPNQRMLMLQTVLDMADRDVSQLTGRPSQLPNRHHQQSDMDIRPRASHREGVVRLP